MNSTRAAIVGILLAIIIGPSEAWAGVAVGAEMGSETLKGAGGDAYSTAPALRVNASIVPSDVYVVQFSYGFANHKIIDPSGLLEEGGDVDWIGNMDLHYFQVAYKMYADMGHNSGKGLFAPFLGSGVGLVISQGRVGSASVPAVNSNLVAKNLGFEIFAGLDLNLSALKLGANVHVGFIPAVQVGITDMSAQMSIPITTSLSGSLQF